MSDNRVAIITSFLGVAGLAACGMASAQSIIKIDGSSTVFPVSEAFAEEFQGLKRGKVRVTVGISGTGGGFKKFCRGDIDIQDASRPILKEEMETCAAAGIKYYELPIAFDALTVAVSPQNKWLTSITVAELKKIWAPEAQGKITHWNQVNPQWPNEPFMLFGAGSDSGTFDYFTEAVVGKAKASRGDYTGSEDDNVLVQGIEKNKNSLGYIPYAYYAPHTGKMKAVAINNGKRTVLPSLENVTNGTYEPLSRPLFLYVSEKAAERAEVREYIDFVLTQGAPLIKDVNYLPLPKAAYELAAKNFRGKKLGTAFGGTPEVGLRVEEILSREAKL